jgi:nucleoid-associated protein YgaU
MPEVAAKSNK